METNNYLDDEMQIKINSTLEEGKPLIKKFITNFPEFILSDFFHLDTAEYITIIMDDFGNFIEYNIKKNNTIIFPKIAEYINKSITEYKPGTLLYDSICTGIFEPHIDILKNSSMYNLFSQKTKSLLEKF